MTTMKLLLYALTALITIHQARAETVQSVVHRYISWRGGRAFSKLATIYEKGSFSDGGLQGPASRYASVGGDVRAESHYGPFATSLAVGPTSGAYTDLAGQRLPLSKLEISYARHDAALLLPVLVGTHATLSRRSPETVDGNQWDVVELDRGGGGTYDYLIARRSGALLGVRIRRNGSTSMETYSDWRAMKGVRLPFHSHDQGHTGLGALQSDTTDFTVDTVDVNHGAPAEALKPLPNRRVVSFSGTGASSGWIPLHLIDNAIFLEISLNGHKVRALLDSGASQTAVDKTFARANGIAAVGAFMTGGQGGTIDTAYAPGLTIQAGDVRLKGVVANLIDFDQPGTRMSPPLVAILGAEVFAETAVDIDYAGQRLRFLHPAAAPKLGQGVALPLGLFEGAFHFPVSIEGQAPIPILLDTGNEGAFQIFPTYWQPRDMLRRRHFEEGGNGGVGGLVRYKTSNLTAIDIGKTRLQEVPAVFEMPGNAVNNETGILGNCGEETLKRFHLVVNFPRRSVSFVLN